mmetsp:Transcript_38109/g.80226  ORF Transcript_38109/g.80226 Transcript_38109/m.80226 type:complete len:273 (+) Transcript_38109:165-983(+)
MFPASFSPTIASVKVVIGNVRNIGGHNIIDTMVKLLRTCADRTSLLIVNATISEVTRRGCRHLALGRVLDRSSLGRKQNRVFWPNLPGHGEGIGVLNHFSIAPKLQASLEVTHQATACAKVWRSSSFKVDANHSLHLKGDRIMPVIINPYVVEVPELLGAPTITQCNLKASAKARRQSIFLHTIDQICVFLKHASLYFKHVVANLHSSSFNIGEDIPDLRTDMDMHSKSIHEIVIAKHDQITLPLEIIFLSGPSGEVGLAIAISAFIFFTGW